MERVRMVRITTMVPRETPEKRELLRVLSSILKVTSALDTTGSRGCRVA
jgi:hypothetical protein